MNWKFIISVVVLFVLTMALGYVIHGVFLFDDYTALVNIMRSPEEAEARFHFMLIAHLCVAIGLTWIYRMGHVAGESWVKQGLRFGFAIALVSTIPMFMIYYVVQQEPMALAMKQIMFETISLLIVGMATAFLNR